MEKAILDMNAQHEQNPESEKPKLGGDDALLAAMLIDSQRQDAIYQAGPYWAGKARNAAAEIRNNGLEAFRGSSNLAGLSYADNLSIDYRKTMGGKLKSRLARLATYIYPWSRIYDAQVAWTQAYARETVTYAGEILGLRERTRILMGKYKIPYSLLGDCQSKANIDGREISIHYLNLLEQHDNIAEHIKFDRAKAVFEIGGGFGANVHLLLENYSNIRKVLYLDIPPNLYVGTQYLKAFYGSAVIDYNAVRHSDIIKFGADSGLEIICIAPWQIEKFRGEVDVFMNSHSFVEMPEDVVRNYADRIAGFTKASDAAIALTTYDGFDLKTTLEPSELIKCFPNRRFHFFEKNTLIVSARKNLYFVSPGKLSFS